MCVKSEVILKYMDFALLVSIHRNLSNDLVSVYSFRIRCRQSRYFPISLVQKGINLGRASLSGSCISHSASQDSLVQSLARSAPPSLLKKESELNGTYKSCEQEA